MTDKELKKLSRLELLEILLEETKENEKLREELGESDAVTRSNAVLMNLIDRLNRTLNKADAVAEKLYEVSERAELQPQDNGGKRVVLSQESKPRKQLKEADKNIIMTDLKLYLRILNYYLSDDEALKALPSDIQRDIRTRTRGILDAKKFKNPD